MPASPARTWELLNDVPRVAPCMPGVELVRVASADSWDAVMHVSIGPIALQFDAEVRRVSSDPASRAVALAVDARESRGRGGAHAAITSAVAGEGKASRVSLVTELTFDGAVAQVAVGPVVVDVAKQLTRRFAECLAQQIEVGPDAAPTPTRPIGGLRLGARALLSALVRLVRRR